jgi:hypothetical protein
VSRTTPIGCRLPPCFSELVSLEARLAVLLLEAQAVCDDGAGEWFCGVAAFGGYDGHRGLKGCVVKLVGWGREDRHPVLGSPAAYDVVYQTILDAVPPCRGPRSCL